MTSMLLLSLLGTLDGTFTAKNGTAILYGDQTVNYQNCATTLRVAPEVRNQGLVVMKVEKLDVACDHPTYWAFHQIMGVTEFVIDASGGVTTAGVKVGSLDEKGFHAKFDDGGQKFFLDLSPTAKGMHIEWSSRSFDDVNFDMTSDLSKI